jgi:imidazolonepropionase-like amidohydrolase
MAMTGSQPGIKFALGENPRRANGSSDATRYPSTRMGVEALIRDRFAAAADYLARVKRYQELDARGRAAVLPPRRDLELEALAEVLTGSRWIHCHSYRQDEILMLCGIAKEYGFKIGTFQHVLEGYKIADAIGRSAVGASAFSDWWAYKLEVQDAIPENGAILREQGVVVSFNSDSNELARRLNTEAGKAVKYGGLQPGEALKFVTLNPAIQLGIADRTGSLEKGKDADFAVWSGDPLSYLSRCEATYVDGRPWFTMQRDLELREGIARERTRLLQRAQSASARAKENTAEKPATGLDAYWRAEDRSGAYGCRECEGGGR